jgi:hypothetical protein
LIYGNFNYNSSNLVDVEFVANQINAHSTPNGAMLRMGLRLYFHPPKSRGLENTDFVYSLLTGELSMTGLPGGQHIYLGCLEPLQVQEFHRRDWNNVRERSIDILVPVSYSTLEAAELNRRGDVTLSFKLKLGITAYGEHRYIPPNVPPIPPGISDVALSTCEFGLQIPQSVWVTQVVNTSGYDQIRLVEFPSIDKTQHPDMANAYTALDRAQGYFKRGDYDTAVGDCRTALEPFWHRLKKQRKENGELINSKTTEQWAECVGEATVTWLQEVLKASWEVTHKRHHSHRSGHYSRLDAQMILAITTTVLSYIARNLLPADTTIPGNNP